jgi:hypothetical protein
MSRELTAVERTAAKAAAQWWADLMRYPELLQAGEREQLLPTGAQEAMDDVRDMIKFDPVEIDAFESALVVVAQKYPPSPGLPVRFAFDRFLTWPMAEAGEAADAFDQNVDEFPLDHRLRMYFPTKTFTEITEDGQVFKGSTESTSRELIFEQGRWVGSEAGKHPEISSEWAGRQRPVLDLGKTASEVPISGKGGPQKLP